MHIPHMVPRFRMGLRHLLRRKWLQLNKVMVTINIDIRPYQTYERAEYQKPRVVEQDPPNLGHYNDSCEKG